MKYFIFYVIFFHISVCNSLYKNLLTRHDDAKMQMTLLSATFLVIKEIYFFSYILYVITKKVDLKDTRNIT